MTLTKRVVACLDVKDGRVVKGLHFEDIKDAGDPVELALKYSTQGADELVFLDITASSEQRGTITGLVKKVATVIDIPFTVGGGIKSLDDARQILLSGADKVGINTAAIKEPQMITRLMEIFGRQCIVVAIDAKKNYNMTGAKNAFADGGRGFWYEVHIYGGKKPTGIDAVWWAREAQRLGAGEILLTSIDKDGTQDGYEIRLTRSIVDAVSIPVVASGGCGSAADMADVFEQAGADAALAASIFHYHGQGIKTVKESLYSRSIPVRL